MVKPLFDTAPPAVVNPVIVDTVNSQVPAISPQSSTNLPALLTIDDSAIDSLGGQSRMQLSALSTKMLGTVRASDADVFGQKLNELVGVAKGMNPAELNKGGVISKITHFFGSAKEKMLAQYQTVEKRMDALVSELNKSITLHTQRITDLEGMYQTNYQSHQQLEAAVGQGKQLLAQLEAGLQQLKSAGATDSFAAQRIQDLDQKVQRLEKRIDDLNRAMLLAKQTAPEIRLLQDNARTLVTKFKDAEEVTIPAWKNAFTLYLVQMEQKKGAELSNNIDDSTDAAFTAQADMLRLNTTAIAKAKQRSVVSIDTLQHVQEQLLGSFDDLQKIEAEGRQARKDAEPKLKALEQALIDRFVK
jgi:uncharacterized protein YaaN involved in tellurite resistance